MSTREKILRGANRRLRQRGFNAFSYYEIARSLNIKAASIHYHFPRKSDLGKALIEADISNLEKFRAKFGSTDPVRQLSTFTALYAKWISQKQICLLGAMAADYNTLDKTIQKQIRTMAELTLTWLTDILEAGYRKNIFYFNETAKAKALLILTNLMGAAQLARIMGKREFHLVRRAIFHDLTQQT